jgi:alpha-D-ribose 1-methylphosphonate 5-triphosphate diphosphatase PhnM
MRVGKAPKFKLISLKEHQIWENQYHELNTYRKSLKSQSSQKSHKLASCGSEDKIIEVRKRVSGLQLRVLLQGLREESAHVAAICDNDRRTTTSSTWGGRRTKAKKVR